MQKKYWLIKSEPETYSIDHLKKDKSTWWENIRNYQARNFMTQQMQPGDLVLFYHSNAEPPGLAGIAMVSSPALADKTQFDKKSDYFEPRATKEKPVWFCCEFKFVEKFNELIPLGKIKEEAAKPQSPLAKIPLLQKGQRLSIQPLSQSEFECLAKIAKAKVTS